MDADFAEDKVVGCSERGEGGREGVRGREMRGRCHFEGLGGLTHGGKEGRKEGGREEGEGGQAVDFSSSKLQ